MSKVKYYWNVSDVFFYVSHSSIRARTRKSSMLLLDDSQLILKLSMNRFLCGGLGFDIDDSFFFMISIIEF